MKRTLFLMITCSALAFACSKDKDGKDDKKATDGSRIFKVDDQSQTFVVSVIGAQMGTPDASEVAAVIENSFVEGFVDSVVEMPSAIEGGVHSCLKIQDPENRAFVIARLKSIETSLDHTVYSIESVDDCN